MAYFVVYALDRDGAADIRAAHRAAHRARLRAPDVAGVTVHIGGPLTDDGGDMIGSMLVIEAGDKAAVEGFVAGDPYARAGLYHTVDIHPFNWGLGTPQEVLHG